MKFIFLMNVKNEEQQRKRMQLIQPFQLFCMQNREIIAQMNPNLKGTGITSLLAKKWRSLDQNSKGYFEQLSLSLRDKIPEIMNDYYFKQKTKKEKNILIEHFYLPHLFLESRRDFGVQAAETSQKIYGFEKINN